MGNAHFSSTASSDPVAGGATLSLETAGKGFREGQERAVAAGSRRSRFVVTTAKRFGGGSGGKKKRAAANDGGTSYDTLRAMGNSAATVRLSSAAATRGFSRSSGDGDGDGATADGRDEATATSAGRKLAIAARGAAASSRRSALVEFGGRRSSAERAALRVNLSTRRSAIIVAGANRPNRRVSPVFDEEAVRSMLAIKEAAATSDAERQIHLLKRRGSDVISAKTETEPLGSRRDSSLPKRRRSSHSKPRKLQPIDVSLASCKPFPVSPGLPECLGTIRYRHAAPAGSGRSPDLAAAREESLRTGRPLLVVSYRRHWCCGNMPLGPHHRNQDSKCCAIDPEEPLAHPLLVEAAESLFVPVLREVGDNDGEHDDDDDDEDHRGSNSDDDADIVALSCSSASTANCCQTGGGASLRLVNLRGAPPSSSSTCSSSGDLLAPELPRRSWSAGTVASAMVRALRAAGGAGAAPPYLDLLAESEGGHCCQQPDHYRSSACGNFKTAVPAPSQKEAYLGTSDARRAEAELACLDGVSSTGAGWIGRQRAVCVTYDPSRLSFGTLLRSALATGAAAADEAVYVQGGEERTAAGMELGRIHQRSMAATAMGGRPSPRPCCSFIRAYPESSTKGIAGNGPVPDIPSSFRPADAAERKASLRSTPLSHVPLTGLQSARANMLVRGDRFDEAVRLLSPRQGVIFMAALKHKTTPRLESADDDSTGAGKLSLLPDLTDLALKEAWKQLDDCGLFDE